MKLARLPFVALFMLGSWPASAVEITLLRSGRAMVMWY